MTAIKYTLNEGRLSVNDIAIETEYHVGQVVETSDVLAVRLDIPENVISNQNVLGIGIDGKILWTIQKSPHGGTEDSSYALLVLSQEGEVIAETWDGVQYKVNLQNGTISVSGLRRFT